MSVVGGQPKKKKHANTSYRATKHIERTFLISDYCQLVVPYLEDSTGPGVAQYCKSLVDWEEFANKEAAVHLFLSLVPVKVAAFLAERKTNWHLVQLWLCCPLF